ncbi:MAG TPA: HIT domain-containing protein [Planctomicrobium sp.]|nr:HIT domain-containing protein [Planctomicrobium sp.]
MVLHSQLLADCHHLGRLPQCEVLLHRNAIIPWIILVPDTEETDLLAIPGDQRNHVMEEAALIRRVVQEYFQRKKINFAAIGNVVPQLHLHVVGRQEGDHCWPRPVWGNLTETREYTSPDVTAIVASIQKNAIAARIPFTAKTDL